MRIASLDFKMSGNANQRNSNIQMEFNEREFSLSAKNFFTEIHSNSVQEKTKKNYKQISGQFEETF